MITTGLGQVARIDDTVIFIPGNQGRLLTYSWEDSIAYIHESLLKDLAIKEVALAMNSPWVDFSNSEMLPSLNGIKFRDGNHIVAIYKMPGAVFRKVQQRIFLKVVGYENIELNGSFIARGYINSMSLAYMKSINLSTNQLREEVRQTMDGKNDNGTTVMAYTIFSRTSDGETECIDVYDDANNMSFRADNTALQVGYARSDHLKQSVNGNNISTVLRDIGGISNFEWNKNIPLTPGDSQMCKELIWRFYVDRSALIGGSPIPTGEYLYNTATTIQSL